MAVECLKDSFGRIYAFRVKPLKIDEVDKFLEFLAKEFNVPKPNYQIFKVTRIKNLDPIKTELGGVLHIRAPDPIPAGAFFDYVGNVPFLTLLFRGTKGISRKSIIHEFFHYIHFLKEGIRLFPKVGEGDPKEVVDRWVEEEKRTKRKTNEFWKEYRKKLINQKFPFG